MAISTLPRIHSEQMIADFFEGNFSVIEDIHGVSEMVPSEILPEELVINALMWLPPGELAAVTGFFNRGVSRIDQALAQRSYEMFQHSRNLAAIPGVTVINRKYWEKCFGQDAVASLRFRSPATVTPEMMEDVRRLALQRVEGNAGWTVIWECPEITLDEFLTLARNREEGRAIDVRFDHPHVFEVHKDIVLPFLGPVAISNSVLLESGGQTMADREVLLAQAGCEMPHMTDVVQLCVLRFFRSFALESVEQPYGNASTLCVELCEDPSGNNHVTVGHFIQSNLPHLPNELLVSYVPCHNIHRESGVGGSRRL